MKHAFLVIVIALVSLHAQTPPRHVSPGQKTQFINAIKSVKTRSIVVATSAGKPERRTYANEIAAMFDASGWTQTRHDLAMDFPKAGVLLVATDNGEDSPKPDYIAISKALEAAHIPYSYVIMRVADRWQTPLSALTYDVPVIFIGRP